MAAHPIRIPFSLKTLGFSLFLLALFASGAKAGTIFVDVGTPGSGALDINVVDSDNPQVVDILFLDNKTLEYEAGTHLFLSCCFPTSLVFAGVLLDASGDPIPATAIAGQTPASSEPLPLGIVGVAERTVFSGIRLFTGEVSEVGFTINWADNDRPLVGVIPEPSTALLVGFGLLGLGMRRKRAN